MDEKQALRLQMKRVRSHIRDRDERAGHACRFVISDEGYLAADLILLYCAAGSEMAVSMIGQDALLKGKQVAVPRMTGKGRMVFIRINEGTRLINGAYGIPEPEDGQQVEPEEHRALVIAPGLAYDMKGWRLGYGGGYYDRYLSMHPVPVYGLCFEEQIIPSVPHDAWDHPMDRVITDRGYKKKGPDR